MKRGLVLKAMNNLGPNITRRLLWIAASVCLLSVVLVIRTSFALLSHKDREFGLIVLSAFLFLSPLVMIAPCRRIWYRHPRTMLLTWWILPLGASLIAAQFFGDMGEDQHMFTPILVWLASIWAMFGPVVVVGVLRGRDESRR